MTGAAAGLTIVNASVVALLLVAALGKFASPLQLRAALDELFGVSQGRVPVRAVQAIALVELSSAAALLVRDSRLVAAWLIGAIGLSFAAAGIAGRLRHSTTACGCLGRRHHGRPLGWTSALAGVGLLAVVPLNLVLMHGASDPDYASSVPAAAAGASLVIVVLLHRHLIATLLRRAAPDRRSAA